MRRSPFLAAVGAAAFVASGIMVWAVAYRTAFGARLDATILKGFMGLGTPDVRAVARTLVQLVDPAPFAVLSAAIVCIALIRRRLRLACMAGIVLFGANLTTQALKPLTAEPRGIESMFGAPSSLELWPSGHATASMTLALCLVAVAPPRLRALVAALGGTFMLAVTYSLLVLGWHYPSDVLGAFSVAVAWTLTGLAAIWAVEERRPADEAHAHARRLGTVVAPAVLAALVIAGVVVAAALARLEAAFAYAQANTAFVAAATVIGTGALTLAAALAAVLRD
jgi:membrane-associated phospholipid phosphatase